MKINLKTGLGLLLLLGISFHAQAQKDPERKVQVERIKIDDSDSTKQKKKGFQKDKLVFGGGGGFGLGGNDNWNISLSPSVGYRFTDQFTFGINTRYTYSQIRNTSTQLLKYQVVGGGVFARYAPFYKGNGGFLEGLFAQTESEYLRWSIKVKNDGAPAYNAGSDGAPGLFFGGGYITSMGRGPQLYIVALYNVLYDSQRSPYSSPLDIRIGFGYAL